MGGGAVGVRRIAATQSAVLARAGLVCASLDDLEPEFELGRLLDYARAVVVLTDGQRGGLIVERGRMRRYRAIPSASPIDPTGAGDVFLAALMFGWLQMGEPATPKAVALAAAAASLVIEGPGLDGVPTAAQIRERLGG